MNATNIIHRRLLARAKPNESKSNPQVVESKQEKAAKTVRAKIKKSKKKLDA